MSNYVTKTSDKSKQKALRLCMFGGFIGLHHFYVGRYGMGFLYSVTMGFAGIGWIADIIKIALGNFVDNVGEPLRK